MSERLHRYHGKTVTGLRGPYDFTWARVDPKGEYGNKDREYRAKWLKDQKLSARDGWLFVTDNPDYRKTRLNIFRRIWQWPMDRFEAALATRLPVLTASNIRLFLAMSLRFYAGGLAFYYYCKYHDHSTWTMRDNWKVLRSREWTYPGDPNWPHNVKLKTKPQDFAEFGFKNFDSTNFKSSVADIEKKLA